MKLFKPGRIGRLSLRNRIIMAPMGIRVVGGRLLQRDIDYYEARAAGGTGLITTGVGFITSEIEPIPDCIHVCNENLDVLTQLAEAVHRHGAKLSVEFTAGFGRVASLKQMSKGHPVAPSPSPCFWAPDVIARELTIEKIEGLVRSFESAAKLIVTAGADAVTFHAHEGYLFDQFQTALWNKRTDKYGGDLEGRLTLALEAIEAVKRGAGADFPIIFRFGLTHYLEGGREVEEGLDIARRVEAAGVDAIEVDAGCYETHHWPHPTAYQALGCMIDLAGMTKKVVNVPVITVGKLGDPKLAERVLREGKADFICMGRPLLADPDWANKAKEGRWEDIRPCIGSSDGCSRRLLTEQYVSCQVNPATGMEKEYALKPAEKKKSVLVVGGGPGGMEAARVAALRGHQVTLWEKGHALGGNIRLSSVPDFKQEYRKLIDYLSTQIKKLGVTVRLGKEATPEAVQELKPDAVILATGGIPYYPEIPGKDGDNVTSSLDISKMFRGLLPWSAIKKKKGWQKIIWFGGNIFGRFLKPSVIAWLSRFWLPFGKRVIIIGGGYDGCEMGVFLTQKGRRVAIVESSGLDNVAGDLFYRDRNYLLSMLNDNKVELLTDKPLEITDQGVAVADKDGNKSTLAADTVMLTIEMKPNQELLEALKGKVPEVYAIGDCVEPRRIIGTMWEGYHTARLV